VAGGAGLGRGIDWAMQDFSISFTRTPASPAAAAELALAAEADLGGASEISGGLLLATAAAGAQGPEVGRLLSDRWGAAELLGTSFEGLVSEGRVWRDQPALGLLAWRPGAADPVVFGFEPGEQEVERVADGILAAAGATSLSPSDLVLLFPDADGLPPIESLLAPLESLLGGPAIAGAGASGVGGESSRTWVGTQEWAGGGLVGVLIRGAADPGSFSPRLSRLVSTAVGSRRASPWLDVTSCRSRWVDRLEGEVALEALLRESGIGAREALERHLERLLVRVRRGGGGALTEVQPRSEDYDEERYIVGVDERRGAFSLPVAIEQGDALAFAWPDAALAREGLRDSLDGLGKSPWLLQFCCRARDSALHGDSDVESAWVAAHAPGRRILGTVAPFQLGPGPCDRSRLLVHSSVLAALHLS
jgi:small ligand-binding sensory domain FIST